MTESKGADLPTLVNPEAPARARKNREGLVLSILLVMVLGFSAYLRFAGLNWDEFTHPHPDERFLTMVEASLRIPLNLSEYFDTATSALNPHNVGYGFFVYGTLPIFIVRYLAEWSSWVGYDQVHLLGRAASATFDLLSVFLVYLIGSKLYRRRVGLLAAALTGMSVLLIQHSHFFVVDPFANTFILMAFYFAVCAMQEGRWQDYLLFGLGLGMAVASKVSAAPLAGVLVLAGVVRLLKTPAEQRAMELSRVGRGLAVAAVVSLVAFRLFQPYAFVGTSFFDVRLNSAWLENLREVRWQASGRVGMPPAWQWADRTPVLFSLGNLLNWGMGLPLGLAAWLGWGWALVRMFRKEWDRHLLPVAWTGGFFVWQSIGFTPAMRYQLPVYPTLALMAAWGLWKAWELAARSKPRRRLLAQGAVGAVGAGVLVTTALWALAFVTIYTRPETRVEASRWIYSHVPGPANVVIETAQGEVLEPIPLPSGLILLPGVPHLEPFRSRVDGTAEAVLLPYLTVEETLSGDEVLQVTLLEHPGGARVLARATYDGSLALGGETRLLLALDRPLAVREGESHYINIQLLAGDPVGIRGSVIVSETSWDLGLPVRIDGRDGYGGIYTGANQEIYWSDGQDDNGDGVSDKLERLAETLEQGDVLAISSNRQYGSLARLPGLYPLTTAYYRALLDCPVPEPVWRCAAQAKPGQIEGQLGYELVAVFESNPKLGSLELSDQGAEEAFTVYDHPKVLIFSKQEDFSAQRILDVLGEVDTAQVGDLPPGQVESPPPSLLLPLDQSEVQESSGTWSKLFPPQSWINRSEILATAVWWVLIGVIGLAAFPLVRIVFPGFKDGAYPLARLVGLLVVAWACWLLGSLRVPVARLTVWLVFLALVLVSGAVAWRDRKLLSEFLKRQRREILVTEILALGLFLAQLGIRLGNPDLWHPSKGGEKPMDFAYLNAVLKSVWFPPYDPWFAGGYINYYYFGFVLIGMPIKMLGLTPSVGYNLVLPSLFSLAGLAAYSVGYNLVVGFRKPEERAKWTLPRSAGVAAALALIVLGNLDTVRMVYDGLKRLGTGEGEQTSVFLKGGLQAAQGVGRVLVEGATLPYGLDQWYWNPSRAIPTPPEDVAPITEFPFFTFLYADPHAHMISLPLAVAGLAWGTSWLLATGQRGRRRRLDVALGFVGGAMILGSLQATNTWDLPAYLGLCAAAALAAPSLRARRLTGRTLMEGVAASAVLVGLAFVLYLPYAYWYGRGYTNVEPWPGPHTSLGAYLRIHGLFLFAMVTWMIWETRQWMASTPLSELNRLRPALGYIVLGGVALVAGAAYSVVGGVQAIVVVLPVVAWAVLLLLRPGLRPEKCAVLVMTASGLCLTLLVEVVRLQGDIGRMNTVFKFYMQVWTLLSISAAAAFAWVLNEIKFWRPGWRGAWIAGMVLLIGSAALYPLTATPAKMRDRMQESAPHSLDGMAYMPYSTYYDMGESVSLRGDYDAIRWMQENIEGTLTIVEAHIPEYRWGSRFSIYTGLPTVLGWNWHQRQQRVASGDQEVWQRALEVTSFYTTRSVEEALRFLEKYGVRYVIVGEMERIYYENVQPCWRSGAFGRDVDCDMGGRPIGMAKPTVTSAECSPLLPGTEEDVLTCPTYAFEKFEHMTELGELRKVYEEGQTVIYEVMR